MSKKVWNVWLGIWESYSEVHVFSLLGSGLPSVQPFSKTFMFRSVWGLLQSFLWYKWNYVSFPVHFNISETYFQFIICVAVQVHASGLEALILISIFSFIVDILLFSNCASVLAQFVGFFCPELCITKVLGTCMNNKCI